MSDLILRPPTLKDLFLNRLRGSQGGYKRYGGLPLRYAGGKSLALGFIIERLPSGLKKIVSPFFGGGSFEIACAKELKYNVLGYDIFDILVNYWNVQITRPRELAEYISQWNHDKETYVKVKDRLKHHWLGETLIQDDLELAAHYWFNHSLSYGPSFLGFPSSVYLDGTMFRNILSKVSNFQCSNLKVCNMRFEDSIPRHMGDFLYCDPPYYLEGDSSVFRGMYPNADTPIHHNNFDHDKLADLLHSHKGGFILSYNDCSYIRDRYKGFEIIEVGWQYTMGMGQTTIGAGRREMGMDGYVKKSSEVLIISAK